MTDMPDYRTAYRNALNYESQGVGMLKAAFGLDHVDYACPPGDSWSYASLYAFADLGMTFYGGGGFEDMKRPEGLVPSGNRHWGMWFCNLRQIPYSYSFAFEDLLPFDHIKTSPDIDALLDRCAGRDGVVWSFHPHMALKKRHWDGPNYKGANLVEWGKWKMVEDWPDEVTQKFYRDFRAFLRRVKADGRFEFTNTLELKKRIKPRTAITKAEIPAIRKRLLERLGPVHEPASWSVADVFQASVALLRGEKSYLPSKDYGFLSRPQGVTAKTVVSSADLRAAAEKIDLTEFIPPAIRVGDKMIGPADFLYAALEVLETGAASVELAPREQLGDFADVPTLADVDIFSGWPIHAKTLNNDLLNERLKLQLWTLRFE